MRLSASRTGRLALLVASVLSVPLHAQTASILLKAEKFATIGDDDSGVILSSISAAVFDSRKRLVVADYTEGIGLIFDSTGRELGRFGRKGAGPGEFRALDQLGWIADTLWVFDGTLRRISFLHDNKLIRTNSTSPSLPSALAFSIPLSIAPGVEFGLGTYPRGVANPSVPGHLLYRRRYGTSSIDTIMWLPQPNSALALTSSAGGRANQLRGTQPLDDSPIATGRKTGGFVVVDRWATRTGRMSNVNVRVFNRSAATVFERELTFAPVEVTDAIRAALRSRLCIARNTPVPMRMCTDDEANRALWFPQVLAPANGVTGCSDGTIWIRLASSPLSTSQEYFGLRDDGGTIGRLRLPANAHILDCRQELFAVAIRSSRSFDPEISIYRVRR